MVIHIALGLAGLRVGVLWADSIMSMCAYIHESVCAQVYPDYAGIIVERWRNQSLKVRVVWLISSSLYHFN